jgi:hypothetical protein
MTRELDRVTALHRSGAIEWRGERHAWQGDPGIIVDALRDQGFQEYNTTHARSRPDREPAGGVWQGLDSRTGAVASAIWVKPVNTDRALVFLDVDGEPVIGP